jgi:hypothetical protein
VDETIDQGLEEFFRLLQEISDVTLRHVTSIWQEHEEDGARIAAASHARSIIKTARRQSVFDDSASDLRVWLNSRAGPGAGIFGVSSGGRIQVAGEATKALVDCLLAIIAADRLSSQEYDLLVLPLGAAVRAERYAATSEDYDETTPQP